MAATTISDLSDDDVLCVLRHVCLVVRHFLVRDSDGEELPHPFHGEAPVSATDLAHCMATCHVWLRVANANADQLWQLSATKRYPRTVALKRLRPDRSYRELFQAQLSAERQARRQQDNQAKAKLLDESEAQAKIEKEYIFTVELLHVGGVCPETVFFEWSGALTNGVLLDDDPPAPDPKLQDVVSDSGRFWLRRDGACVALRILVTREGGAHGIQTLRLFQSSDINDHEAEFSEPPRTDGLRERTWGPPVMLQWGPELLPLSREGHLNMHLPEVGGAYASNICIQPRMDFSEWKALELYLSVDDGEHTRDLMSVQAWLHYLENVAPWPSQGADW